MFVPRKWSRMLLILPLLVSILSLTPARAAEPNQVDNTALVIWCPDYISMPYPNRNNCTSTFSNIHDLVQELILIDPDIATAGTIWIGKNYRNLNINDATIFRGDDITSLADYDITFQGGWNGLGTGDVDLNTPSTLDDPIYIQYWFANVTVRNLRMIRAAGNCGVLLVRHIAGAIELDGIEVSGSNLGAKLENTYGSAIYPVTVTNSVFNANQNFGLMIQSNGTVTLTNVEASYTVGDTSTHCFGTPSVTTVEANNGPGDSYVGTGLYVDNRSSSGDVEVHLNGNNVFLGNSGYGLEVHSKGSVIAEDLIAYENGFFGIQNFDGVYIDNRTAPTAKPVSITGSGAVSGNGANGLKIYSNGLITIRNVTAADNLSIGVQLITDAPVDVQAASLSGVNANNNAYSGIVLFANGQLTVSCSRSYNNGTYGLYVRAANETGSAAAMNLQSFLGYSNLINEEIRTTAPVIRSKPCP